MNTETGGTRPELKTHSHMKEDARCVFMDASKTEEERRRISTEDIAPTIANTVCTYESIPTNPDDMMSSSDNPSSKDTQLLSKPSLSYIALISKVILSSPSQKLNLASIYRAMEERFPYLRSRGPGWRNSVRHNLSVNDCFVKVSRCEDGRGHYWGVHQAHLRDFQQGNFRQCREARGRRGRERCDKVEGCLAWMESSCFLRRLYRSRPLGCVEPQCPLQERRRYQLSSLDWIHYQPWSTNVGWVQSPCWMRQCYFPDRLPDSYGRAPVGRGHNYQPMTSRLHYGEMNDPAFTSMQESYDSRFMTPPIQAFGFFGCWCTSPLFKEFEMLLPYKVNFQP